MALLRKIFFGRRRRFSKRSISKPRNFQHCFHGEYDTTEGRFCGLPPQWSNLLDHEEQEAPRSPGKQGQGGLGWQTPVVISGDKHLDQPSSKWIRNSYFSDDEDQGTLPNCARITSLPNVSLRSTHEPVHCRVPPPDAEITISQPLLDIESNPHHEYVAPDPYNRRRDVWSPQSLHSSGYWSGRQHHMIHTDDINGYISADNAGYISAGSISSRDNLDDVSYSRPPDISSPSYAASQPLHSSPPSHHHGIGRHSKRRNHRNSKRHRASQSDEEFRASLMQLVNPADPRRLLTQMHKIGEGSTGVVYSAKLVSTGEIVAVKKMNLKRQQRRELLFNEVTFLFAQGVGTMNVVMSNLTTKIINLWWGILQLPCGHLALVSYTS